MPNIKYLSSKYCFRLFRKDILNSCRISRGILLSLLTIYLCIVFLTVIRKYNNVKLILLANKRIAFEKMKKYYSSQSQIRWKKMMYAFTHDEIYSTFAPEVRSVLYFPLSEATMA